MDSSSIKVLGQPALSLKAITYRYTKFFSNVQARGVHDLSLKLELGQVYGLLGPNGSGKSTLLKLLSGELYPQLGKIYLFGQECTHSPMWYRARQGLLYLSQNSGLAEQMTVLWNLSLARQSYLTWRKDSSNHDELDDDLIRSAARKMGVEKLLQQKVCTLSGGEKRRVELARVFLNQPMVLILDEPFAALDQQGIQATLLLIKALKDLNALVLLTDHQNKYIEAISNHKFFINEGRLSFL
ncbi:MAG: hypothetical protein CMH49_00420 [Myxococcales bacterium]|nr:hypothetical protein [Myxococcales bacterium]